MRQTSLRQRQQGLSIIALVFVGAIVVVLAIIGAKLVPAINEYIAVERAVQKIAGEGSTVGEIRAAFDRHAVIDDIKSISSRDLEITKENDRVIVSYAYTYSIPILDNVRLVIDFAGSTKDRRGKAAGI